MQLIGKAMGPEGGAFPLPKLQGPGYKPTVRIKRLHLLACFSLGTKIAYHYEYKIIKTGVGIPVVHLLLIAMGNASFRELLRGSRKLREVEKSFSELKIDLGGHSFVFHLTAWLVQ